MDEIDLKSNDITIINTENKLCTIFYKRWFWGDWSREMGKTRSFDSRLGSLGIVSVQDPYMIQKEELNEKEFFLRLKLEAFWRRTMLMDKPLGRVPKKEMMIEHTSNCVEKYCDYWWKNR